MYTAFHNARNYTDDLPKLAHEVEGMALPVPTHERFEASSRIKWKGPSPKKSSLSFWGEPVAVSKKNIFHEDPRETLPTLNGQRSNQARKYGDANCERGPDAAIGVYRKGEPEIWRGRRSRGKELPAPGPAAAPRSAGGAAGLLEVIYDANWAHQPRSMDLWVDSFGHTTSPSKRRLQSRAACPPLLAAPPSDAGSAESAHRSPGGTRWATHSTKSVSRHYALQAAMASLQAAGLAPAVA